MAFTVIETQEQLDAIIQERLKREREASEKKLEEFENIKAEKDSLAQKVADLTQAIEEGKTDKETINNQLAEMTGKVKTFETSALKVKIALENGLPYDLADRLVGENEAEITADAKKLSNYAGQSKPTPPLKSIEDTGEEKSAYLELLKGLKEGE